MDKPVETPIEELLRGASLSDGWKTVSERGWYYLKKTRHRRRCCKHVGGFVPEFGPKPKNWKPKSNKKVNIHYWLCMDCGTKRKVEPKEQANRFTRKLIDRLREELEEARKETVEALRDSERLDWLEDRSDIGIWPPRWSLWWVEVCEGKLRLRAAIDAAMLAPKGAHKEK